MIGGHDVIIPIKSRAEALGVALRAVLKLWPKAVLEDAETGESFRRYSESVFAGRREVLAFRDESAARRWADIGADPSLDDTLIHFLVSDGELTLVIDSNPSPQVQGFAEGLKQTLSQGLFAGSTPCRRRAG